MNLPVVLEVAIGLVFIYLILALLASEIQEVLATVFQWRAKHLKESIETLLGGDGSDRQGQAELLKTRRLANDLYGHPLIASLNYQKQGLFPNFFRKVMGLLDRLLHPGNQIFGDRPSAPSYIPADVFATAVLETLQVNAIVRELNHDRLEQFQEKIQTILDHGRQELEPHLNPTQKQQLSDRQERLTDIMAVINHSFQSQEISLDSAFKKIVKQFLGYLSHLKQPETVNHIPDIPAKQAFIAALQGLKKEIYLDQGQVIWLDSPHADVNDVIRAYRHIAQLHQEFKSDWDTLQTKLEGLETPVYRKIKQILAQQDRTQAQKFLEIVENLPQQLLNSFVAIAEKAAATKGDIEGELKNFGEEVGQWFDRGMARASGVYKRNAKGIAFLVGLGVAISANADTFHIVEQLSLNTDLRQAIVNNAVNVDSLEAVAEVETKLKSVPVPLGWEKINLEKQAQSRARWETLGYGKQALGWVVSAIAIAMGAPFWFDILGKLIRVRNTGRREEESK